METIGKRIERLREALGLKEGKDVSRPELGRRMALAIGRRRASGELDPYSGETVRRYEIDKDRPGIDATKALAAVFKVTEAEIVYGKQNITQQSVAEYRAVSERALDVARRFDDLSAECQEHVSHQIDLLKATLTGNGERDRAAQHDVVIKKGAIQSSAAGKKRRRL